MLAWRIHCVVQRPYIEEMIANLFVVGVEEVIVAIGATYFSAIVANVEDFAFVA
jgi:hypothetical protein